MKRIGQQAIVIGGSMSGLLAARVLADAYERVTILERDTLSDDLKNRKGVPQGRHVHALLGRGREILEDLLPGYTEALVAQGAEMGDYCGNGRYYYGEGFHVVYESDLVGVIATRPLFETQTRKQVLALTNVSAIEECDVLSLLTDESQQRVTGVRLIRRAPGSAEEQLRADVVVDSTGRGSRTPTWLNAMGYEPPPEESMHIGISYTSRFYRRHPRDFDQAKAIIVAPDGPDFRGAIMLAVEGNRWHLTLSGYLGDHAPTDEEGFLAYLQSLPTPELYEFIKNCEPLTEPVLLRFPANQRRYYEKLQRFPEGLLVFGDALCAFNPKYAQGMSIAALQAMSLRDCLTQGASKLPQRFFAAVSKVLDVPWNLVVGGDLKHPQVEGERSGQVKFINWYLGKMHRAAQQDRHVALAFSKVVNLLEPPPSIMHPAIMWRVLWGNIRTSTRKPHLIPAPVG